MSGELGDFLRTRRSRVQPEDVGLRAHGRRRVPGLRREEVAQLAGVSVDYYIRLEQGRGGSASDAVLDAVARVLRLDDVEHAHLRSLARPAKSSSPSRTPAKQPLREGVRALLESMTTPAFVLGRRMDVLAWNEAGDAVCAFSTRSRPDLNQARHAFLNPGARAFYADWEAVTAETVAYLRLDAGRHPRDQRLAELVGELTLASEDFARLWADHEVREKTYGVKRMNHPEVGALHLTYETLCFPGEPDQLLVAYTAAPGSPSAEKLTLLSSWQATSRPAPVTLPQPSSDGQNP
ncbi:helix-turn-helix transcriptional regulator [Streptantibioticus parmotrematis]|uniref:helix-turn-helix transcriptional regulator n=1 Tax=Streptantibioticus parmotrematis TaxID=2873249 RepID=UPI0033FF8087